MGKKGIELSKGIFTIMLILLFTNIPWQGFGFSHRSKAGKKEYCDLQQCGKTCLHIFNNFFSQAIYKFTSQCYPKLQGILCVHLRYDAHLFYLKAYKGHVSYVGPFSFFTLPLHSKLIVPEVSGCCRFTATKAHEKLFQCVLSCRRT